MSSENRTPDQNILFKPPRTGAAASALSPCAAAEESPSVTVGVTNVVSRQRYPRNGLVDIDCEVVCSDPAANVNLYLSA